MTTTEALEVVNTLLCFISNAVKKLPVDIFEIFGGVAQALLNFSAKIKYPVAQVKMTHILM